MNLRRDPWQTYQPTKGLGRWWPVRVPPLLPNSHLAGLVANQCGARPVALVSGPCQTCPTSKARPHRQPVAVAEPVAALVGADLQWGMPLGGCGIGRGSVPTRPLPPSSARCRGSGGVGCQPAPSRQQSISKLLPRHRAVLPMPETPQNTVQWISRLPHR